SSPPASPRWSSSRQPSRPPFHCRIRTRFRFLLQEPDLFSERKPPPAPILCFPSGSLPPAQWFPSLLSGFPLPARFPFLRRMMHGRILLPFPKRFPRHLRTFPYFRSLPA